MCIHLKNKLLQVEAMGEYLLKSVSLLKQLGASNTRLRQMYTMIYKQHDEAKRVNEILQTENTELREKASILPESNPPRFT